MPERTAAGEGAIAGGAGRPAGLAWSWAGALLGLVYAVPAAVVALDDVTRGMAFAVGVIPPAIVGLRPTRRSRRVVAVFGALVGVPIVVGSTLANVPLVAVAAIFAAAIGAVWLAQRRRIGAIALSLGLPMIGVGLSYTDIPTALGLAGVMIGGSIYAAAVSMLWPEHEPMSPPAPARAVPTLVYGALVGATGAVAATIGFLLDLDHVGWACAASLLVIRPLAEMQEIRSIGRIASVAVGAGAAIGLVRLDPPDVAFGAVALLVVAAVGATRGSRWYITSAFTTFLVFVLLLDGNVADASSRFGERVGETILGVALAFLFGLLIPKLAHLATLQPALAPAPD